MSSWIPKGNATDVCAGVNAASLLRPAPGPSYFPTNLAATILLLAFAVLPLYPTWRLRNTPRFRVVRPFRFSAVAALAVVLLALGVGVPVLYDNAPCWISLVFLCVALTMFADLFYLRCIIFIVESEYARLAASHATLTVESAESAESADDDAAIVAQAYESKPDGSSDLKRSLGYLMKIAIGTISEDEVTIETLVAARKSYVLLMLVFMLPGLVAVIVTLSVVPQYHSCRACEQSLEVPVTFLSACVIYVALAFRFAYVAYTKKQLDPQDIIPELASQAIWCGPTTILVVVLQIVDPDHLSKDRKFLYYTLFVFPFIYYTISCMWYQIYRYYYGGSSSNTIARVAIEAPNMLKTLEANAGIMSEFEAYCAKFYVSENLRFFQDLKNYKTFFADKGDNWRISKAKKLLEIYLVVGGPLELNVSNRVRDAVRKAVTEYSKEGSTIKLYEVFDEALKDIAQVMREGFWNNFWADHLSGAAKAELDAELGGGATKSGETHRGSVLPEKHG